MEAWSADQPLADLESRVQYLKIVYDRLLAEGATYRILGDAMADVAQALSNLYRFDWRGGTPYADYKAKRAKILAVRDSAFDLRDEYLIAAHSEQPDPYVSLLLKAREIGWPKSYREDLLEHDFRWLRTADISKGFCWCLRELGTHIGPLAEMRPVWNVWGNDGLYFSYREGTLREIADKSYWGTPRYGGKR